MDHEFSWSQIEYSEKMKHISFSFRVVPALKSAPESIKNQEKKNGGKSLNIYIFRKSR